MRLVMGLYRNKLCFLIMLMGIVARQTFMASSFSADLPRKNMDPLAIDTVIVERTLEHTSPAETYSRCLSAWREKNLGLWLLPPAILWKRGHENSGIGLVVARVPPAVLLEGITDAKYPSMKTNDVILNEDDGQCDDDDQYYWMEYKVLNPSIITWPVRSHRGLISFQRVKENATKLTWKVEWEPMPLVGPLVRIVTTRVVTCAVNFIASEK